VWRKAKDKSMAGIYGTEVSTEAAYYYNEGPSNGDYYLSDEETGRSRASTADGDCRQANRPSLNLPADEDRPEPQRTSVWNRTLRRIPHLPELRWKKTSSLILIVVFISILVSFVTSFVTVKIMVNRYRQRIEKRCLYLRSLQAKGGRKRGK